LVHLQSHTETPRGKGEDEYVFDLKGAVFLRKKRRVSRRLREWGVLAQKEKNGGLLVHPKKRKQSGA